MITEETKKLIQEAKNIYLIPTENSQESISCVLALFYTLKQLDKNVNIIIDNFPEKLNFLIPSPDFISYPRNFVISVPNSVAQVSQIYYEKTEENLKIHLTFDKGSLKKENIAFYYTDARPDLIISFGIKDFKYELENKLDQFAFLMQSDIINIDNDVHYNRNFGKINIVEDKAMSEIILDLIKSLDNQQNNIISNYSATCLLTGLISFSNNFTNNKTSSGVLDSASYLIKQGAEREKIISELYKKDNFQDHKAIITTVLAKLQEQNIEINKENILKYLES